VKLAHCNQLRHWETLPVPGVLFHTDAVQVAGRLPLNVQQLPVDLLSLATIYGPQGLGRLVECGVYLLYGGGQELRLRSGTQAVPAIAGFGVAAELAGRNWETPRLIQLRERLFAQLADTSPHPNQRRFCTMG